MNENRRSFLVRLLALLGVASFLTRKSQKIPSIPSKDAWMKFVKTQQWRLDRDLSNNEAEQFVNILATSGAPRKDTQDFLNNLGVKDLEWKEIASKKTPRHAAAYKHLFPLCS